MAGRAATTSALRDALARTLDEDLLERAGSLLGEPRRAIARGVRAAFAALFAALARAGDGPTAATALASLIEDPAGEPARVRAELASLLLSRGPDPGTPSLATRLLGALFAEDSHALASALAGFAGLRASSADALLRLAAPLALATLRELGRSERLAPRALLAWLVARRAALAAAVPRAIASTLEPGAARGGGRRDRRGVTWLRAVRPRDGTRARTPK